MPDLNKRDITVLSHILKYCTEISDFLRQYESDYEVFKTTPIFQYAVSMAEMQIGELTGHLSDDFKDNNPNIPWRQIRGMRNLFAHNYLHMDVEAIWNSAINDTPVMENFCQQQLDLYNKSVGLNPTELMNDIYLDYKETALIKNTVHKEFTQQYGELPENLDTPENRATVSKYIIAQLDSGELTARQTDKLKNLKQAIANAEEPLFRAEVDELAERAEEISEVANNRDTDLRESSEYQR